MTVLFTFIVQFASHSMIESYGTSTGTQKGYVLSNHLQNAFIQCISESGMFLINVTCPDFYLQASD